MQKTPRHVKRAGQQEPRHSAGGCGLSGELSFEIPADAGGGYQWGIERQRQSDNLGVGPGGGVGRPGKVGFFPFLNPGQGNPGDKRGRRSDMSTVLCMLGHFTREGQASLSVLEAAHTS